MRGVVPEFRVLVGRVMVAAVKRTCEQCAAEFLATKASVKAGYGRYCSRSCTALAKPPSAHSRPPGPGHQSFKHGRFAGGKTDPIVHAAHLAVQRAVYSGELVKPTACEQCEQPKRLDAHHDDYSQPLVVAWLCRQCHADRHRELEAEGRTTLLGNEAVAI